MGRNFIDMTGMKYGKLTVIKNVGNNDNYGHAYWECLCECGNKKIIRGGSIRSGETKSCGCLYKDRMCSVHNRKPYGEAAFNRLYFGYKRNAKNRNHFFGLDIDFFKKITKQNCFYCGTEPSQKNNRKSNGDYIHNGIDRIDSSKGYTTDNVVPCCKKCNIGKMTASQSDFLEWIEKIYNHSIKDK